MNFMVYPRNPVAFQLLAATCARRPPVTLASAPARLRERLRCQRPRRREVRVSDVKSLCDVTSRDLFLCDFSLFSAERQKEKNSFFGSKIKLQRFVFPFVKIELDRFYFWWRLHCTASAFNNLHCCSPDRGQRMCHLKLGVVARQQS